MMGNFAPDWVLNDQGQLVDRWTGTPKPPDNPQLYRLRKLTEQEQITDLQIKVHLLEQRIKALEDDQ